MEVVGEIKVLKATQEVSASFKKRELVVTTNEQYPQDILIEFAQDKCDLINGFKLGENVKVSINLRGREWTNPQGEVKYFNQIQGWRIEKVESVNTNDLPAADKVFEGATVGVNDDSLPF
jgi:translation initiation factor IF-3